jgi:pilus assembly protein CpaC
MLIALVVMGLAIQPGRAQSENPAQANSIQVSIGESVTLAVDSVSKLAVADPTVADVVPLSDKEVSVIGKKVGATTLSVVRSEGKPTLVYRVEVGNDMAATVIRQMTGSSNITVRAIGDSLVLDGTVDDELQAQRAVQIASAYKGQVVNLIEVKKPRQIKIRTRIAEVNTEAIKNIGLQWFGPQGQVQYAMSYIQGGSVINGLIPTASEYGTAGSTFNPNTVSLTVLLDMLITKSYARLLSEPTLVTFSGKEASFLVGEQIPIVQQLPQSFTVEFKDVGVRMKIKPTSDSQNRINTTIHAEVSEVSGTGANGIPIIAIKQEDTTLQINDGQTVVMGGLLENNINKDLLRKLPWLGDIPVIGMLFRDKQFDQAKREVLFFMTPEVLKDGEGDPAANAQTPVMQHWIVNWNKHGTIPSVDKQQDKGFHAEKDDWGLHNPDSLGFGIGHDEDKEHKDHNSKAQPKPQAKPTSATSTNRAGAVAAPTPSTSNFEPARPTGN